MKVNEMTRYQVPREETSINLTNISEQVYWAFKSFGTDKNMHRFLDIHKAKHV